jgi:hypothetical protein
MLIPPRHVEDPLVVAGIVMVQETAAVKERVMILEVQQEIPVCAFH